MQLKKYPLLLCLWVLGLPSALQASEIGERKEMEADRSSSSPQNRFYTACKDGDANIVQQLLAAKNDKNEQRIDPNLADEESRSPFWIACREGHNQVVDLLLAATNDKNEQHIDANLANKNGATPLYIACHNGHDKVVQQLLAAKNDKNEQRIHANLAQKDGATPLLIACQNGHEKVVQQLLAAKNNKNEQRIDANLAANGGYTPLYIACHQGHEKVVQQLLAAKNHKNEQCIHANLADENGFTPFYLACQKGHDKVVQQLLVAKNDKNEQRIDANLTDNDGATPLLIACQKGHDKVVEQLLAAKNDKSKQRIDANLADKNGVTPLWIACQKGHDKVVEQLLAAKNDKNEQRIDANLADNDGATPLLVACQKGHDKVVQQLLAAKNDKNEQCIDANLADEDGFTPLYVACQKGHDKVVQQLLAAKDGKNKQRIDASLADEDGFTPFYLACQHGHDKVVQQLLAAKNDQGKQRIDAKLADKDGWSPLYVACHQGHDKVVQQLLSAKDDKKEQRIDANLADNDGATPFLIACQKGHDKVLQQLLAAKNDKNEQRIDANLAKKNGATPLYIACYKGHEKVVQQLLAANNDQGKQRIDANLAKKNGCTPFYIACENGHEKVVGLLLVAKNDQDKQRIDANLAKKNGTTPLLIACQKGHAKVVGLLLVAKNDLGKQRIDANLVRKKGWTLLYIACKHGHDKVVQQLLAAKNDKNEQRIHANRTTHGPTPLDIVYIKMEETQEFELWHRYSSIWDMLVAKGGRFNRKVAQKGQIPKKPGIDKFGSQKPKPQTTPIEQQENHTHKKDTMLSHSERGKLAFKTRKGNTHTNPNKPMHGLHNAQLNGTNPQETSQQVHTLLNASAAEIEEHKEGLDEPLADNTSFLFSTHTNPNAAISEAVRENDLDGIVVPQGGIPNLGNTCYANAGSQILVPLLPAILPKKKLKETQAEALRAGFQELLSNITRKKATKLSMTSLLTAYSHCHFPEFEEGMYRQHDAQAFLHLGFDKMGVVPSVAITTQPVLHITDRMQSKTTHSYNDYLLRTSQTEAGHFYQLVLPSTATNTPNKPISLQNLLHQQDTLLSNITEPKALSLQQYFAHFQQHLLQKEEKSSLNALPTYKKEDSIEFALRHLEPITQIFTVRGFHTDEKQVQQWIEHRTLRRNDNQETNKIPSYELQLPCTQNYTYHVTGPYVLFHLKLFAHHLATNIITKKDMVILPERTLVLPTSESNTATFHFAGAVMHRGPYGSGHYVAYRPTSTTEWALFDDATVTLMSLDTVLQHIKDKKGGFVPYLLLYKKSEANAKS